MNFLGLLLAAGLTAYPVQLVAETKERMEPTVVFLGDSLTAGFELPIEQSYPSLIAERIKAEGLGPFRVVNAGVSGDTSASGLRRLEWILRQQRVDVLVVALGANDGLRGVDPEETRANLRAIIDRARERHPRLKILLAGILLPPNFGFQHTEVYKRLYFDLAREKQTALLPFLLDDVAGIPALNLPDGMHPNEKGYQIVADRMWTVLKPLLQDFPG